MEVLYAILSWGSPLGISLFMFFMASGAGTFLWGISHVIQSNKQDSEETLIQCGVNKPIVGE